MYQNRKFKKGAEVILIHPDKYAHLNLETGDTYTVEGYCPHCPGMILNGMSTHFDENDFSPRDRPLKVFAEDVINREALFTGINRLMQLPFMASEAGFIPVAVFKAELSKFIDRIGVGDEINERFA
jgi:hypothetical protein